MFRPYSPVVAMQLGKDAAFKLKETQRLMQHNTSIIGERDISHDSQLPPGSTCPQTGKTLHDTNLGREFYDCFVLLIP